MKELLFKLLANLGTGLIWLSDRFYATIAGLAATCGQLSRLAIANITYWLLKKLDQDKLDEIAAKAEKEEETKAQNIELQLLASATKVRDHAKQNDWTDHHSEAISAIGNALLNECDWEEEHVHQYLKEVVESIPGLHYGVSSD